MNSYRKILKDNSIAIAQCGDETFMYVNGQIVLYGDAEYWTPSGLLRLLGANVQFLVVDNADDGTWSMPSDLNALLKQENRILDVNENISFEHIHRSFDRAGHLGADGNFYCDEEESTPSKNTDLYVIPSQTDRDVNKHKQKITNAQQLRRFDIVKIIGRKDVIVVDEILGKYESSITVQNGKISVGDSNPYPGCWAVKLLESNSVVPISDILYDVDKIYRNGETVYES
jgi:hypothetical protein